MWKLISVCLIFTIAQCESRCDDWYIYANAIRPFPLLESNNDLFHLNIDRGTITLEEGESMYISCVGNYLEYYGIGYLDKEYTTLTCNNGSFYSDDWLPQTALDFKWISCAQDSPTVEKHTEEKCGTNNEGNLVEIYVKSKLFDDHLLYEICFDDVNKIPLYAKYTVNSYSKKSLTHKGPKQFKGNSEAFYGMNLDLIYDYGSQRDVIWAILGSNTWDYHNYDSMLEITTLDSYSNYEFQSVQKSIYNFINTVPVWTKITSGTWSISISGIKSMYKNDDLTVYSGAWGVQTLKDENGDFQPIYIESIGSKRYPAPAWLYRVVYEANTKKGIAFLILHNPFVTLAEAETQAKIFPCGSTTCPSYSWINNTTPTTGYIVCCEIDDFRRVIKDLPDFETEGLLT